MNTKRIILACMCMVKISASYCEDTRKNLWNCFCCCCKTDDSQPGAPQGGGVPNLDEQGGEGGAEGGPTLVTPGEGSGVGGGVAPGAGTGGSDAVPKTEAAPARPNPKGAQGTVPQGGVPQGGVPSKPKGATPVIDPAKTVDASPTGSTRADSEGGSSTDSGMPELEPATEALNRTPSGAPASPGAKAPAKPAAPGGRLQRIAESKNDELSKLEARLKAINNLDAQLKAKLEKEIEDIKGLIKSLESPGIDAGNQISSIIEPRMNGLKEDIITAESASSGAKAPIRPAAAAPAKAVTEVLGKASQPARPAESASSVAKAPIRPAAAAAAKAVTEVLGKASQPARPAESASSGAKAPIRTPTPAPVEPRPAVALAPVAALSSRSREAELALADRVHNLEEELIEDQGDSRSPSQASAQSAPATVSRQQHQEEAVNAAARKALQDGAERNLLREDLEKARKKENTGVPEVQKKYSFYAYNPETMNFIKIENHRETAYATQSFRGEDLDIMYKLNQSTRVWDQSHFKDRNGQWRPVNF